MINFLLEDDTESDEIRDFAGRVTPGHVLAYATGANCAPASGFHEHPKITFVHDDTKVLPAANTCSCELILFVNEMTVTEQFMPYMLKALMNGAVFSTL